jgi:chromosome transmission fidelity protein 4
MYDSHFILRVLSKQRRPNQGTWVPVFNGVKHAQTVQKTERYWPVGLLNDKLMCIIVRVSHMCLVKQSSKAKIRNIGK